MALILLIEDDPVTRHLITALLATSGHVLIEAENGKIGLQQLREMRPDLIITDIVMPEIEGLEVVRCVRRCDRHIPILAISGPMETLTSIDYLEIARALGADATIRKPLVAQNFISEVENLLAHRVIDVSRPPITPIRSLRSGSTPYACDRS